MRIAIRYYMLWSCKRVCQLLVALLVPMFLLVPVPRALAGPVFVDNYSFETLPASGLDISCGDPCALSLSAIPGWNKTNGASGQWTPGGYLGNPPAIDGSVVAFSNGDQIWQDVGSAVAGTTYTLTVALLHRTDQPFTGVVQLEIDGGVVATATGSDGGPGTWSDWALVYIATAADAGKTLTILLSTIFIPETGGVQGVYDNVRLDAVAAPTPPTGVPEAGTLFLFVTGLLGLLGYGWRTRRQAA